ncbi:MAG: hypothetical protein L6461_06670 [Anaerolineae bacterium]|nr:hypothetical protein [Anaerolineae bacterium]
MAKTMIFDQINSFLLDLPIYLLNGLLWLVYALVGSLSALLSAGAATVMALVVDSTVQQLSGSRPLRQGRGESPPITRTAQILTAGVFLLWFGAQWGMGAPVPWIGAAMWLTGLAAVLISPAQRFNLLWFVKSGVAVYALAVIGSRLYLNMTSEVSPEAWAGMLGTAQTAVNIVANTRGNVTTVIVWALWLVIPLGYFSLLVQKLFQNPVSLVNPLASYADMLAMLRDRGGR